MANGELVKLVKVSKDLETENDPFKTNYLVKNW